MVLKYSLLLPLGHVLQGTCGMLEWWTGEDLTTTADYRQRFFSVSLSKRIVLVKKEKG